MGLANSSNFDGDTEGWPPALKANHQLLSIEEIHLVGTLLRLGQGHLFINWDAPGINDHAKHTVLAQLMELNDGYIGGLSAYIHNARALLLSSSTGENPLEGWRPVVPNGVSLQPLTAEYNKYEEMGLDELGSCGFVLVAGGLGERLGYNDIKVGLPTQTITNISYLEFYCRHILEIQHRYAERTPIKRRIPLAIMVSDDTSAKTNVMLMKHHYFGLERSQITLLKQKKVVSMTNNNGEIGMSGPYVIDAKPHGHGDVHALMHSSGTATEWMDAGTKWIFFFQDTNGLALLNLPALLGVSVSHELEVNSVAVPRMAKQAVGAITKLVHVSGKEQTVNVEYNQLDPLLRATGFGAGDTNDPNTGVSPFPGNTNQLLFRIQPYVATLAATSGMMPEFVNPKYADAAKTALKKPTRLECMMQDYPKLLGSNAKVGFTTIPGWAAYSPCKNNAKDAAASAAAGVPGASPYTAESDQYNAYAELMRQMGVSVPMAPKQCFLGIRATPGPCIVFSPETVMFPSDLRRVFPRPSHVSISSRSVLVVDGDVRIQSLRLDGAVRLIASSGVMLSVVHPSKTNEIVNAGYDMISDDPHVSTPLSGESFAKSSAESTEEIVRMRGYCYQKKEEKIVTTVVDSWNQLLKPLDSITMAETLLDSTCHDMVAVIVGSHKIDPQLPMAKAWSTIPNPSPTETDEQETVSVMRYPASVFSSLGDMLMSGINSTLFTSSEEAANEQPVGVPKDLPVSTLSSRPSESEVDQTVPSSSVATVTVALTQTMQNKSDSSHSHSINQIEKKNTSSSADLGTGSPAKRTGSHAKRSVNSLDLTPPSSHRDIQVACLGIVLYVLVLLCSVCHERIFKAFHTFLYP